MELPNSTMKLQQGIDLINEAYREKVTALQSEIAHWKKLANKSKDKVIALDSKLEEATERIGDLEAENGSLIEANRNLVNKYNALKQYATQMEQFKKDVMTLIEHSPSSNDLATVIRMSPTLPEVFTSTAASAKASKPVKTTVKKTQIHKERARSPIETPHEFDPVAFEEEVDAMSLYSQIKNEIGPEAFQQFTDNIRRFNNGQSAESTLITARMLIRSDALYNQFSSLVHKKEAEALEHTSNVTTEYKITNKIFV
eukprot:Colp12_sorted_trinity150504_noHs@11658